jgi:hypothetical protein
VTAAEQLTEREQARLRARDTMKIERGAVRSANLDSTQVASVVGSSVTVPNRVSMRTRSAPATSEFPHPPCRFLRGMPPTCLVSRPLAAGRDTRT